MALTASLSAVTASDASFSASGAAAWLTVTGRTVTIAGIATGAQGGTNSAFFQVAGPTVLRTYTFPDASMTVARTDAANTFTGVQTFSTPIATGSVATMTATVGGGVPTPPNNTTTFLRGDGTFAAPAGGSSTWDTIGAAAGSATTANGANTITYNTAPTADSKVAWTFGETSAATNGTSTSGIPNQVLLKLATLASSTQSPLSVYARGTHVFSVPPTGAQILAANGGPSAPMYSFAAATNTGLYWSGSSLVLNINSTQPFYVSSSSITMAVQCTAQNGSAGAPGIVDSSAGNNGIYFGSGLVGISISSGSAIQWGGGAGAKQALFGACTFANLGTPTNGSFAYCSDCDPATLVDSTCTNAGAKTGSFAAYVNGSWKCFT